MSLRAHRRSLVVWRQSAGSAGMYDIPRPARTRRVRRRIRIVALLTLVTLRPAVRAVRARWRPLLAGTVLTVAGVIMRDSTPGSVVLLPGLLLLLTAPLIPGAPETDRRRRAELERELAVYTTSAQRHDLEATLDRYPDDVTRELRDILAGQAKVDDSRRFPARGRH
jgi:hypothetical protein